MSKHAPRRVFYRTADGYLLVESLIVATLMSFVSMAMLACLVMNVKVQMKTGNYTDAITDARTAIQRIGMDVRTGRSFGDVFGDTIPDGQGNFLIQGSASFPSGNDPIYGNGQGPAGGAWPATWGAAPTTASPWKLSNKMLIVQVPVYDANRWPTQIPVGSGNPAVTNVMGPQCNVETHIYNVVADPSNPGEFALQYFSAPGYPTPNSGYVPANHTLGPETLVKGIVGPKDAAGNLKIFQYLAKKGSLDDTNPSGQAQDNVNAARMANYTGVIINLEISRNQEGAAQPVTVGFKQEVFIRNNALATSIGDPN